MLSPVRIAAILAVLGLSALLYKWREYLDFRIKISLFTGLTGGISNFLAIAFNGWRMPVIGAGWIEPGSIWKSSVNPNLPWLVDRFDVGIGIASIGDFFLVGGAVLSLSVILCEAFYGLDIF